MTTGQFPKRRETDQQAKRRVEGIEARRDAREAPYRGVQVFGVVDEIVKLFRSRQGRDAFGR